MGEDKMMAQWINPLAFLEVDEPWATLSDHPASLEDALHFLCSPETSSDIESLVRRYREISHEGTPLFTVPAENDILLKLVWPLRYAKGCYMLGNYLGTIALCGMAAEMLALLIFEMSDFRVNDRILDDKAQEGLFGNTFEKLGQERRIAVLRTYGLMNEQVRKQFDAVKRVRRRYLHFLSQEHKGIARDAVEVFDAVHGIMVAVFDPHVKDRKPAFSPTLMRYLERKGFIRPEPTEGTPPVEE